MAWQKEPTRIATAIADLRIHLLSPDPRGGESPSAEFEVQIFYNTGEIKTIRGDLGPELTQSEVTQLVTFLNNMRARAVARLLP